MSEVSERTGAHRGRQVVVTPQPPLAYLCQHAIAWILLVVVVLLPAAWAGTKPWALQAIHILIWWGGLLWAARLAVMRRIELVISPVNAPVLVLVSYVVIRYGLAEVEPVARPAMMLAVSVGLVFFLALQNAGKRSQVTSLVVALAVVAGALVALAGWQALGPVRWGQAFQILPDLARATFPSPVDLAGFLAFVFPIVATAFFFSRWSYAGKVFLLLAMLALATGLALSQSRAGWLGGLASVLVMGQYLQLRRNVRSRWMIVGAGLWLALMVATMWYTPAVSRADSPVWTAWLSAWRLARENWLLGVGPGMFEWRSQTVATAHSEYAQTLAEYGVIGLALGVWGLVMFVVAARRILGARAERYSVNTPSNRYAFVVGALAAVVAVAAHGLVANPLQVPAIVCAAAIVAGTGMTCGVHPSGKLDDDLELPGRRQTVTLKGFLKWGVVLGLLFLLGLQATRLRKSAPAAWFHWRGEIAQANLDWAGAEVNFQRAWGFDGRSDAIAESLGDYYLARATWDLPQRAALASEALRWYDRAYTRNPYRTETLVKMGRLHDLLGRREQAAERYRRAVETAPNIAAYHAQFGLHHLRWGEEAEAQKSFDRAVALDPADLLAARARERLTGAAP